ncbi:MAG TPA: BatA domain-containing protein [Pirellulaceae bacterium]|nr:BatA domain-containing protein [Pirellulaceae bacterium]
MQFVHQILTWGFLLALVPLLIHLINMMRHRRVKWAAMEFLLASYKKHRKWVWLKQLLLLLSRMAVVALIVAMLAQLKTRDQWLAIFGGRVTHHYVLVDDSYSMSDRVAGATAMDAAKQVMAAIVGRATQEDSAQKLTLIRFSQARGAEERGQGTGDRGQGTGDRGQGEEDRGQKTEDSVSQSAIRNPQSAIPADVADFNAEPIDSNFEVTLERKIRPFEATQLALGPLDALSVVKQLLSQTKDETSIVYLLSDFRTKDWGSPTEYREALGQLRRSQAEVHLVNCAKSSEPNLGVISIEPADETRAAGVPLFVNVKVKNFGAKAASKVQLKLQSAFYPADDVTASQPESLKGEVEDLATLLIESIGPGEVVDRRVQVYFPQPGKHVVEASLPEDPVEADNHRWCVIDFPDGERVLVIDGSVDQQHAYFLEVAFRPLERSNTGIRPEVKPASFLRDATLETLNGYSAIYLLDVSRLDGRAADTLEAYVTGGGGVAIFAGPTMNTGYYNQALYKEGQGLLPAPLGLETDLAPALDPTEPDLELTSHPVFSFFTTETNPLIRGVKIDRYRQVADQWKPGPESAVEIIGRTRDKSPLIIEKRLGQGEVLLFLTTLAPDWNDWAKNPSFVVVLLKTQSYLATAKRLDDPRLVGTPVDVALEAAKYRPDMTFIVPGEKTGSRQKIDRRAEPPSGSQADAATLVAALGRTPVAGKSRGETDRAGVYEAWPVTTRGEIDLKRWALNVEPDEGDLTPITSTDLIAKLEPVKVNYHLADQYQQEDVASTGYNLSTLLLMGLIALLIGEQVLAYSASYHVTPGAVR